MRKDYYLILHVRRRRPLTKFDQPIAGAHLNFIPILRASAASSSSNYRKPTTYLVTPTDARFTTVRGTKFQSGARMRRECPRPLLGAGIEPSRSLQLNGRASSTIYLYFDHSKPFLRPSISCLSGFGATSICVRRQRRSGWKV